MTKTDATLTDFMTTAEKQEAGPKVAATRRGKRAWVVYLDPDTARRLRVTAAILDRSMQRLGEEAADLLLDHYKELKL